MFLADECIAFFVEDIHTHDVVVLCRVPLRKKALIKNFMKIGCCSPHNKILETDGIAVINLGN